MATVRHSPQLTVIRGSGPREAQSVPRKRFDWDAHFRRPEPAAPPRFTEQAVIPILEGWVRVLQRQAEGTPRCRAIGED
jgi:hypothetical protein